MKTRKLKRLEMGPKFVRMLVEGEPVLVEEQGKTYIRGVIPYNSLSEDLGGFREKIAPSAFSRSINSGRDIKALVNHDDSKILGRTKNGTLQLVEVDEGLMCVCELGEQSYAKDLLESVKRGDVETMSFGFVPVDVDVISEDGVAILRSVKLYEVSFGVPFPAYEETTSEVYTRNFFQARGVDPEKLDGILAKGKTETDEERVLLKRTIDQLSELLPKESKPVEETPSASPDTSEIDTFLFLAEAELSLT